MSSAELTILLRLHTLRMILFLFCCVVITLFAFRTCQCNSYAHDFSTSMCHLSPAASQCCRYATSCYRNKDLFFVVLPAVACPSMSCKIRHKKKTYFHCRRSSVPQKQVFVKLFLFLPIPAGPPESPGPPHRL